MSFYHRRPASRVNRESEPCERSFEAEYIHCLDTTYGSAREVECQVGPAHRLGLLKEPGHQELQNLAAETSKVLNGLLRAPRKP